MVNRKRKRQLPEWILTTTRWLLGLLIVGGFISLSVSAFFWARFTDHYTLKQIKITGNNYLERDEISKWVQIPPYARINSLNLTILRTNLEKHPYIKAARISRDFPSTIKIDIFERKPIAYIDHTPYYLVDDEGIILPLKEGIFDFDVPTLTGFNPADELYPIGEKCLSKKVQEAVEIMAEIKNLYPKLYDNLAELKINIGDEYILCLSKKPTKIYLGSKGVLQQIRLLNCFERTIQGLRSLYDYTYVDLRYDRQIVIKERKNV
ncbi:MAG: FtsQ-type POTRA domain-containing protein [Candidatus Marinimicrobia bacterium]|nr:FtsQ-type POTRA domain-containing protein [Candidatus Neomarinimicrobiota bacterium]MBL7046107.1 FtsQ-type POTRA domain-containing protein [Candidatus Neomarinimicrobiota bacterium]